MAITKRKLRNVRPKALFGADGAIMATAITLQTANDTVNTIMHVKQAKEQANAIKSAARTQADAIRNQATAQSQALSRTNDNNTRLTEKQIETNKELSNDQRDAIKDISQNILLAQGQENSDNRKEASKLVVKKGGSIKRKLKNTPIARNGNLPFIVTDGGFTNYVGTTPEGYDLYELIGNDHEHYHKTSGGKYKSGVGVKFASGNKAPITVEGEGNQHSPTGELMLVTPDDAMFISKHSIKGFNPTNAVFAGVNPVDAFATQEYLKGGYNNPFKGRKIAAQGTTVYEQQPDFVRDNVNNVARVLATQDNTDIFENGYNVTNGQLNQLDLSRTNVARAKKGCSLKRIKASNGGLKNWWNNLGTSGQLGVISAGANTLGAIGGTVTNWLGSGYLNNANKYRSEVLGSAYSDAGTIMADAYNRRRGIDESLINLKDFETTPGVATLRTARVNKNAELARIDKQEAAARRLNNRSSLSSAKRMILDEQLRDKANADRAVIFQQQANESEQIKQQNAQMANAMSMQNAEERNKARQAYASAKMDVAKYNNSLLNENILGAAEATSNAALAVAGLQGDTAVANATNRSNAINNTATIWNNALQTHMGNRINLFNAMLGADSDVIDFINKRNKNKLKGFDVANISGNKAYNFSTLPKVQTPSIIKLNVFG